MQYQLTFRQKNTQITTIQALYQTQNLNYNYKFLAFLARIYNSNSIELASYVVHVFVTLCPCAYGLQETLVSLENTMKTP